MTTRLKNSFTFACQVTSQHPYCEEFIGAPHVYTIDVNVLSDVEKVVKEILLKEVLIIFPFCFCCFSLFYCGRPKKPAVLVPGPRFSKCGYRYPLDKSLSRE